jgi:hypothetical protein
LGSAVHARTNAYKGDIKFITNFGYGQQGLQHPVKRVGPAHFVIDLP